MMMMTYMRPPQIQPLLVHVQSLNKILEFCVKINIVKNIFGIAFLGKRGWRCDAYIYTIWSSVKKIEPFVEHRLVLK